MALADLSKFWQIIQQCLDAFWIQHLAALMGDDIKSWTGQPFVDTREP